MPFPQADKLLLKWAPASKALWLSLMPVRAVALPCTWAQLQLVLTRTERLKPASDVEQRLADENKTCAVNLQEDHSAPGAQSEVEHGPRAALAVMTKLCSQDPSPFASRDSLAPLWAVSRLTERWMMPAQSACARVPWQRRLQAGMHSEGCPARSEVTRVRVQPGSELQVAVSRTTINVEVGVNDDLEHILVEGGEWAVLNSGQNVLVKDAEGSPIDGCLRAWIPHRWCGISVESEGGTVQIQKLKEGRLVVKTTGGNVKLGDIQASSAQIMTSGGTLDARSMRCPLDLNTGGGDVSISHLTGPQLDIASGGGKIVLGPVYGDDVKLSSGGGDIVAKGVAAPNMLQVRSDGGSVAINGLDGRADITTKGGAVHLQLYGGAKEVTVTSDGGDVAIFAPMDLQVEVDHDGSGPASEMEGAVESGVSQGERGWQPEGLHVCRLKLKTGSGRVSLRRRSWLESISESITTR